MDGPGVAGAFGHWAWDLPWLLLLVASGTLYVRPYVPRRGPGTKHPRWRLAAFLAGLAIVAVAVHSPVEYWGNSFLWVNFLGFLLLTMIAAPLIVLGAPATLAFRTLGADGRRRLRAVLRSRAIGALTFPVFSWLAFAIVTYIWQFTALTDTAAKYPLVRDAQMATLLLAALLFWTPALCADPIGLAGHQPQRIFHESSIFCSSIFTEYFLFDVDI